MGKNIKEKDKIEDFLIFLKRTKEGNFAEIEMSSIKYIRLKREPETYIDEDEYYYSVI